MDANAYKIFFEKIKEIRETYFVEYSPPVSSFRFATLYLTFFKKVEILNVVDFMEKELKLWITRYRVPLMVSAWDDTETLFDLSKYRPCNFLTGYFDKEKNDILLFWALLSDEQIPDDALNANYLKATYRDIPFKTSEDRQWEISDRRKKIKTGWLLLALWLVVVPVIVAFIDVIMPFWLQVIIFFYCVYKAIIILLELFGKSKKSQKDKEWEQKEIKMRHYYYHCEQNPEGFFTS